MTVKREIQLRCLVSFRISLEGKFDSKPYLPMATVDVMGLFADAAGKNIVMTLVRTLMAKFYHFLSFTTTVTEENQYCSVS